MFYQKTIEMVKDENRASSFPRQVERGLESKRENLLILITCGGLISYALQVYAVSSRLFFLWSFGIGHIYQTNKTNQLAIQLLLRFP